MRNALIFPVLAFLAVAAEASPFSSGSLAVLQVGTGSAALSSATTAVFIDEYSTVGSLLQTITIPTGGGAEIGLSGTATTDGELALSSDKTVLTFAGYAATPGTAGPVAALASTINRAVGVVNASGSFSRVATGSSTAFNGSNVRGAVSDGQNYWMSGDSIESGDTLGGIWYSAAGGTPTQVRLGNLRAVNIFNGNLTLSSGASTGPHGISSFTGLPTGAASSSLQFAGAGSSGTGTVSPNDFAISPSGNLAYVADDRTAATGGGIQRWTFDGSSWSLQYTLSIGTTASDLVRQLTVDFSGANPVIYATTSEANANRLISISDTDAGAGASFTLLATAGANTVFRGVDFSPVPEPSMLALLTLGLAGLCAMRHRSRH